MTGVQTCALPIFSRQNMHVAMGGDTGEISRGVNLSLSILCLDWPDEGATVADIHERMKRNPVGDWTIHDIEVLCRREGIEFLSPRRGDHYKITHASQTEILTVPAHRPIRPVYIRMLVKFVERVRSDNGT